MKRFRNYLVILATGLVFIDLAYLNWHQAKRLTVEERLATIEKRLDSLIKRAPASSEPSARLNANQVSSPTATFDEQSPPSPTPSNSKSAVTTSSVKEYFVPLGSGNTISQDWVDITSAKATIDSSRYGSIEAVYFEASLQIVNGELHARLVDETGNHTYYSSDIFHNSSTPQWKTSTAVSLNNGTRTYKVQLRSTSGELGTMAAARLRILVK
ncbi:hypothetical protein A3A66_02535 [Microgenomates group bacterium RIFCSPLOWO2_01_FULL_46_13]|nr:MAG: hypothetical protein A2783_03210 [Microgenomates group bacterium RIFCSPHIGHO2_01_FULL_45_11]OGV94848.1 MAG: hypothetical protein A3A66_02535 [Microgenomates group bacterium RIFCSPLOWO2_01_FULL_46_13]